MEHQWIIVNKTIKHNLMMVRMLDVLFLHPPPQAFPPQTQQKSISRFGKQSLLIYKHMTDNQGIRSYDKREHETQYQQLARELASIMMRLSGQQMKTEKGITYLNLSTFY